MLNVDLSRISNQRIYCSGTNACNNVANTYIAYVYVCAHAIFLKSCNKITEKLCGFAFFVVDSMCWNVEIKP